MGIRVALNHTTRYTYDRPVELDPHTVRLRPAPHARTTILSYSLQVEPPTDARTRIEPKPRRGRGRSRMSAESSIGSVRKNQPPCALHSQRSAVNS